MSKVTTTHCLPVPAVAMTSRVQTMVMACVDRLETENDIELLVFLSGFTVMIFNFALEHLSLKLGEFKIKQLNIETTISQSFILMSLHILHYRYRQWQLFFYSDTTPCSLRWPCYTSLTRSIIGWWTFYGSQTLHDISRDNITGIRHLG